MRLWRLSRSRSLRRTAQHLLRQNRTVDGWAAWRGGLAVALRQLDWWRPLAAALLVHVPMVIGLLGDKIPAWLGAAWQVSGTLVGLGVALVVFLLQAAGSHSLSSDATYRALLAHTGLIWPATLALMFLISVGVLERYGADGGAPSAWADTWALVAFVLQVIAFGVAFARTLGVVSPAGVARVLRETFEDAMRAGVETSLLRRVMVIDLHELTQGGVSLSSSFWASGQPVLPARPGVLTDVDRRLPRALADMKLGGRVTLTLEPGMSVTAGDPLATLESARGDWLERMIRRGVVTRAIEPAASPIPVFNDVLDVARRALASGSQSNLRAAMQLAADCLAKLPDAYAAWGYAYTLDNVREPFALGTEDEILRALFTFTEEVFRSGDPEAVALLPHVATALVQAGLSKRAGLLVDQATAVWRHQLQTAHTVGDAGLEQRVHDLIGRFGAQQVLAQQHDLEDRDLPLERRLAAQDGLQQLFRHQALVMKHYVDRAEHERFVDGWGHWVEWAKHWTPEHDVDELQFDARSSSGQQQRQATRALESAEALLEAKQALESRRANLMFALGTWAIDLRRQGKLVGDKWLSLVPYLVGGYTDASTVSRQLRSIYTDLELERLESWQLGNWNGKAGWHPADVRLLARLWGTLLLLRAVRPDGEPPEIELGPDAAWLGPEIVTELTRIDSEPNDWEAAVDGHLSERVKVARAAIERAVVREEERAAQQLANAPLDSAKLESYARRQRETYAAGDYLRQPLLVLGAVDQEVDPEAFCQARPGHILPKRPFTAIEGPEPLIDLERPANALVLEQLHGTYAALAELAQIVDGQGADAAAQAVTELRKAGYEPDVVLVPAHIFVRELLSGHPAWSWDPDPLRQARHYARLSGVPVYDAGPLEATALVVCELGEAVRRLERVRPGDESPVRVEVKLIDEQRAAELLDAGYRAPGVDPDDMDAQQRELLSQRVEVHVDMDVRWLPPKDAEPAALRVELPPADVRGPQHT